MLLIFLGSMLGTFFMELDYILYAYFLEPTADFSKTVTGFFKHGDVGNALNYIHTHRDDIKDKTLHSFLFQLVFGALMIFVASSNASLVVKALILSAFLNSIYRMYEAFAQGKVSDWFWALKEKPEKNTFYLYTGGLLAVLVFCLTII